MCKLYAEKFDKERSAISRLNMYIAKKASIINLQCRQLLLFDMVIYNKSANKRIDKLTIVH